MPPETERLSCAGGRALDGCVVWNGGNRMIGDRRLDVGRRWQAAREDDGLISLVCSLWSGLLRARPSGRAQVPSKPIRNRIRQCSPLPHPAGRAASHVAPRRPSDWFQILPTPIGNRDLNFLRLLHRDPTLEAQICRNKVQD
jgi:hypothetical protein